MILWCAPCPLYNGKMKTQIDKINLCIKSRQFIGVLSSSSAGKASFLEMILKHEHPASSRLRILGDDQKDTKFSMVYLTKEISLKGELTVGDFLKFQACFYSAYSIFEESHLLNIFNIQKSSKIEALTIEEQYKIQIISSLASRPKLILIDEMTEALSHRTRTLFFKELERFKRSYGSTIILATNVAEDLHEVADNILFIDESDVSFHTVNKNLDLAA